MQRSVEGAGVYFYPVAGDFERFLLNHGFVADYEAAIAEVHGPGALDSWIHSTTPNDPALATAPRAEQIDRYIAAKGRKPELAAIVAELITDGERNPTRVPEYFYKVIDTVVRRASRDGRVADHGNAEG